MVQSVQLCDITLHRRPEHPRRHPHAHGRPHARWRPHHARRSHHPRGRRPHARTRRPHAGPGRSHARWHRHARGHRHPHARRHRHARGHARGSHRPRTSETLRRRDGVPRVLAELALHEGRGGGVYQGLGLVLHPLLVVELHIFLVLSAIAVSLPHRRGFGKGEEGFCII